MRFNFCQNKRSSNWNFFNFAGLADLILTATSSKSRNYSLGFEIAQVDNAQKVLSEQVKTVEGVLTCKTIVLDARANNITLPLFEALYDILYHNKRPSVIINNVFTKAILS